MASTEKDLVQLEDLHQATIQPKKEPQECVVCVTQSPDTFDIHTTTTAISKTLLHDFLQKLTNSELPYDPGFAKYICKVCLDLVNDLESAEIEYNRLRDSFRSIISKNPLFCLEQTQMEVEFEGEPRCSRPVIKDEVADGEPSDKFNTVVKLEPMSDEDDDVPLKEYEIQYTQTRWGTVLVSRKGDELQTERPNWGPDAPPPGTDKKKDGAKKSKKKQEKAESEIPANEVFLENGERVFECKVCQRQFKQKGNYNRHVSTHTGVMPFECTICQRRFKRKDHLLNHTRTHTGEKPFECNFCLLKFNQKGSIIAHIRTHTGQEPFQCNVCQKRFKQRPHLNSHIRIHTGEKPYECKVCKRRFIESSKLKVHARTHTGEKPYECTFCGNRFNQRGNLQSHLRTHTGEKPYECTFCQKRFNLKHHLRDHETVHTGHKPYECSVCKQRFNYRHVMQNHLRVMHPPEVMHELYPDMDEATENSERNFGDGNSAAEDERSVEESLSGKPSEEVIVEPCIEVSVKAEPVDY